MYENGMDTTSRRTALKLSTIKFEFYWKSTLASFEDG